MKIFILLSALLFCFKSYSIVDLNLSYTQSIKRVDGVSVSGDDSDAGAAITKTEGYSINWAWYVWGRMAIELNYATSSERITDDRPVSTTIDGAVVTYDKIDSTVKTQTLGAGFRFAFAGRKSAIIPSLSFGYAKYTVSGVATFDLTIDGNSGTIEQEQDEESVNSSYAGASIKFNMTKYLGITIGAKTIMPDFETSEAGNNITYQAGLSWMF